MYVRAEGTHELRGETILGTDLAWQLNLVVLWKWIESALHDLHGGVSTSLTEVPLSSSLRFKSLELGMMEANAC